MRAARPGGEGPELEGGERRLAPQARASRYHRREDAVIYQQLKSALRERGSYGQVASSTSRIAGRPPSERTNP